MRLRTGMRVSMRTVTAVSIVAPRAPKRPAQSTALQCSDVEYNGIQRERGRMTAKIDQPDRRIIGELAADGRVSFAELGRRVSLSSPAVAERVQRLERDGVITGYR